MIGHASLREVVGSDAFGPVAGSHQAFADLRLLGELFLLRDVEQFRLEQRHGAGTVFVLRALVLTLDHQTAREVRQAYGGIGLVDMLSTGARGTISIFSDVGFADLHAVDFIDLRHNGHRAGTGVDAALRLRFRHSLHPVRAGFEFQLRVHVFTNDSADDFLVAAVLAPPRIHNLELPASGLCILRIHPEEIAGEDRCFIATCACANLQENV